VPSPRGARGSRRLARRRARQRCGFRRTGGEHDGVETALPVPTSRGQAGCPNHTGGIDHSAAPAGLVAWWAHAAWTRAALRTVRAGAARSRPPVPRPPNGT